MTVEKLEHTWRLWVSYNGARYCGWQFQPNDPSIQIQLQNALHHLTGQDVVLTVAGRTDAGVHAKRQVVSCRFASRFDPQKLVMAFSTQLPEDIVVTRADIVPIGFDAKKHSIGKRYVYRIWQRLAKDPFESQTSWHVKKELDISSMQQAAHCLQGDHDFESFRSANCQAAHARRYIWKVAVEKQDNFVTIDVRGNAFCHNMVRIIVGTLVDVGLGKKSAEDVKNILAAKDRTIAGKTAPAGGLFLWDVYYPDDLSMAKIPNDAKFPRFPVTQESWPFML